MPSSSQRRFEVLVFDVNETLLDLKGLDAGFQQVFGTPDARQEWFNLLLRMSMQATILDHYSDFSELGRAALDAVAARRGTQLTDQQRSAIGAAMRSLPPHPDVPEGLRRMKDAGWRMVALTNSSPSMAGEQLTAAGIRSRFERVLSVDAVRRYKPHPAVYAMAASELGLAPASLLMIAAHAWDVAGAMHAGLGGAFIARPGQVLDALAPEPDFLASDLLGLADRLGTDARGVSAR